jgi:superfamily II DNA or RNA helicase
MVPEQTAGDGTVPAVTAAAGRPGVGLAPAKFTHPFRHYQVLALEAFEAGRKIGRERCYIVMPPGSGKTVVGLEIARRLDRKTVVFGPNTAIQAQWAGQWGDFSGAPPAGMSPRLSAPLSALTYQSLCNLDSDLEPTADELGTAADNEEVPEPPTGPGQRARAEAADRHRRRLLIVNGGDRAALLGLLHPNGRALIERMKAEPAITVVLDECHHLLEMWGHLLEAVVDELGDRVFVVGLTATPPGEMTSREAELYTRLFDRADFEVVAPAVVKEGELAPYQELAYLTEPLPHEREYMASQSQRFDDLTLRLMDPAFATRPFLDWIHQRAVERGSRSGAQVSWERFELDEPALATAVLRLFLSKGFKLPDGARVGERHRQALTADDWVAMIGDFCHGFLDRSEADQDLHAWEEIRRALPAVGYVLTRQGIRAYISPSDRVLALSASKGAAAQTILDLEQQQLGADLRALVLCDFERAGVELAAELHSILDPQAGSASLILQLLAADTATRALDPILVSGRTVACSRASAAGLIEWCAAQVPEIAAALSALTAIDAGGPLDDIILIAPSHPWWVPRNYVPILTRYFEEGRSRCLIGTRGLLGEGWDARTVNVLVDLTAAATSTSVHQMRGRSLRLDPHLPHKVADNWDVVCVAPEDAKGLADYGRFVRKHQDYFALTAAGEIECGVSHVDPALSPFGPPTAADTIALNGRTLARIGAREDSYEKWRIGEPYRNEQTETVRVHFARSIGLPGAALAGSGTYGSRSIVPARDGGVVLAIGGPSVLVAVAVAPLLAVAITAVGLAALAAWEISAASGRLRAVCPSDSLEAIATAVIEALAVTGGIDGRHGAPDLRVVVQADGYYRCYLDSATRADSAAFADALDQALAPLEDPRYIIPRRVVDPPNGEIEALALALKSGLGFPGGRLIYHAVPDYLAVRKERVQAFEMAWNRNVSAGAALFYRDPEAVGIISVMQGENPFATTTQRRTLWS